MGVSILALIVCLCTVTAAGPARTEALPKTVWTYSTPKGQDIIHDMCIERLLAVFAKEQWILEIITANNIRTYLRDYDNYHNTLLAAKGSLSQLQQIELLKLFVLRQYGGLWLDPDVILIANLSWIGQLPKLPEINTFEQDNYELVLFSTTSNATTALKIERKGEHSFRFKQTAIMLALKDSKVLSAWIDRIKSEIEQSVSSSKGGSLQSRADFLKDVSLRALHSLLASSTTGEIIDKSRYQKNQLTYYKIWQFSYTDYQQMFEKSAATNDRKVIVEYYLKEDIRSIKKFSGSPKYFIWLGAVSRELNAILNPAVSSMQIMVPMSFTQRLWPNDARQLKCTHYVMNHSLIYSYLIRHSKSEQADFIPIHERDILQQCQTSILTPIWNYVKLTTKIVLVLALLLLAYKSYRIVMGIAFPLLVAKLTQKVCILHSFFFRLRVPQNSTQPI